MRILVVGAGGVGGYFGGRLVEKGEDVTFLVRTRRKGELEKDGLVIQSINGDFTCRPNVVTASDKTEPFDLILFSTKAYHLAAAIQDIKPFVGENTVILPLLNGIGHLPTLQQEFGLENVIGGLCFIETTLNKQGHIVHTSKGDQVTFGEFENKETERIKKIEDVLSGTKASFKRSSFIEQEMWHKYLLIAAMSSMTTLMRAPVGSIFESDGGKDFVQNLFSEIASIMLAHQAPLADDIVSKHLILLEKVSYETKSSMQRDMEKGYVTEGDHLQGYLLNLAQKYNIDAPLLHVVYQNLKVYEVKRKRQEGSVNS
ncbi:2-dehydropantoate 2-reductase [Bacillus sp. FJAT-45350]|uniref:2-dehydropantoate 2-reductase n=1 Tax=Bacillus sp. FJAT-45350 TaxID=2011014 RepID=UPI000BB99C90|nr:2-dehydropantoate 2-reductase [Bacillus sp. FJAT-45350]